MIYRFRYIEIYINDVINVKEFVSSIINYVDLIEFILLYLILYWRFKMLIGQKFKKILQVEFFFFEFVKMNDDFLRFVIGMG